MQDDPLLFDYNVKDRVNDFIAAAITQVHLTFATLIFMISISSGDGISAEYKKVKSCMIFDLTYSYLLWSGKCNKDKSCYVDYGWRLPIPIRRDMVQADG